MAPPRRKASHESSRGLARGSPVSNRDLPRGWRRTGKHQARRVLCAEGLVPAAHRVQCMSTVQRCGARRRRENAGAGGPVLEPGLLVSKPGGNLGALQVPAHHRI